MTRARLLTAYALIAAAALAASAALAWLGRLLMRTLPPPYAALPFDRLFFYFVPLVAPAAAWTAGRSRRPFIGLIVATVLSFVWAIARALYGWSVAERAMDDLAVGGAGLLTQGPLLEGLTVIFLGAAAIALLLVGLVWSVLRTRRQPNMPR